MTATLVGTQFSLANRVVLLTGGTGHLGQAMCLALAEAGASVVLTSRNLQKAQAVAAQLPVVNDATHHGIQLNQLSDESVQACFSQAIQLAGQVDVLVNNAQQSTAVDWTSVAPDEFRHDLANVAAYFQLAKLYRDHVVSRATAGSIVMIGSMYGVVGSYPDAYQQICQASPVQYHALKGGVIHMCRHLAVYWAPDNIRVNCLSPGPFPSPQAPQEMVGRLCQHSPMKRMGHPHELTGPLLLLTSDAGSYITGQNLLVDGGWTAW